MSLEKREFFGPFSDEKKMRDDLRKPFKEIGKLPRKTKTGKVIQLDYVGHAAVTDRLNAVSPDWTWNLDHVETYLDGEGLPHVAGIIGSLTVGGKSITEGGDPDKVSSYGEELKLAISDFIRRGAMRFGVALDLWSKEELEGRAADKAPVERDGRTGVTRRESAAPSGSSGVSATKEGPPRNATTDASSPSSAAPEQSDAGVEEMPSRGSGGVSTPPASGHQHTPGDPAPKPEMAKKGWVQCAGCGNVYKPEAS